MTFEEERKYGEAKPRRVGTFVVGTILSLSGVLNALLYRLTRASIFQRVPKSLPIAPLVPGPPDMSQLTVDAERSVSSEQM